MKPSLRKMALLLLILLLADLTWLPGLARSPEAAAWQTGPGSKIFLPYIENTYIESGGPPLVSTSLYMLSKDPTKLSNEGCALGKRDLSLPGMQDSVVVLAFGYPQKSASGVFGTHGYGYPAQSWTIAEIEAAVENFGYAYWNCVNTDFDSHLRIAIGTNNYQGDVNPAVNSGHGKEWARLVTRVNDWFVNACPRSCDGQVDAVGANDIELSWNSAAATTDWLNGYAAEAKYLLYNFGAIEGCPWLAHPTYTCLWGSLDKVWYVVWGAGVVRPVPEIYLTSGVNAEQWYLMSVYSVKTHHEKIQFIGPMTETQACRQEGGCPGIDNPPANAWWQLFNLLNADWRTAGEALPYATDIKWLGR